MTINRQGFSHRDADAKSLLDEAIRRGMGERDAANGRSERGESGESAGPLSSHSYSGGSTGACAELDRTSFAPCNEVS